MSMTSGTSTTKADAPKAKSREANPRDPLQDAKKGKDFGERMDRLSQADGKDAKAGAVEQGNGSKGPVKRREDDSDRRDGFGGGNAASTASDFARTLAMAQASPPDAMPPEHLARIVAALEELAEQGANAEYQLSLPAGATMVEGAVIGRDPTGKLTVQLLANAAIPVAALQQLQTALRQRLAGRTLQLGKLTVQSGGQQKRG